MQDARDRRASDYRVKFAGSWRFRPVEGRGGLNLGEYFQSLADSKIWPDDCFRTQWNEEPSPMWIPGNESRYVHWNWIAIFSYAASLGASLLIWRGLFRAVEHLVK